MYIYIYINAQRLPTLWSLLVGARAYQAIVMCIPGRCLGLMGSAEGITSLHATLRNYSMLRDNASGPEIGLPGWSSAGFELGKAQNRPSDRRPAGG